MKLLGNGMKMGTTVAVGVGAAMLLPVVLPVIAGVMRPIAKAAIKGGMIVVDRGKVAVAEAREMMEDLSAEARDELKASSGEVAAVVDQGASDEA